MTGKEFRTTIADAHICTGNLFPNRRVSWQKDVRDWHGRWVAKVSVHLPGDLPVTVTSGDFFEIATHSPEWLKAKLDTMISRLLHIAGAETRQAS